MRLPLGHDEVPEHGLPQARRRARAVHLDLGLDHQLLRVDDRAPGQPRDPDDDAGHEQVPHQGRRHDRVLGRERAHRQDRVPRRDHERADARVQDRGPGQERGHGLHQQVAQHRGRMLDLEGVRRVGQLRVDGLHTGTVPLRRRLRRLRIDSELVFPILHLGVRSLLIHLVI